ncbi:hypothetical protein E2C01_038265 [Portunus trituberculatus]|uniref:Uncharacterized protein n=1 Tax=Portunus trituberculatus TaxID=210409 RepID=A0A5B7FH39_PORTR|nr:hypothetical protein [Portunus trituberculatus]
MENIIARHEIIQGRQGHRRRRGMQLARSVEQLA